MDVITEGKKIQNELVELRRYFHSEFHTRSPARPA